MAQNLTIAGNLYSDVPSLTIPKTGGGDAVFPDTSDANAGAADILAPKTAYVNGVKLTGTGTGGGGMTTGTLTPSSDITTAYTITHNLGSVPSFFAFFLSGDSAGVTQALIYAMHYDGEAGIYGVSNATTTGYTIYQFKGNNTSITNDYSQYVSSPLTNATSTTVIIHPEAKSKSIKSGKTYRWVAVP